MFFSIFVPIILMLSCPVLLWILAKPPFRVVQPGLRFKMTSMLVLLFWGLVLFSNQIHFWYWIAGLLLLVAFLIFCFMVWSVLCWGYTIRMLLVLNEHQKPVDVLQWQKLHAGSNGIQQLTLNRIQALKKLSLVKFDGHQLITSRRGLYLAKIGHFFRQLFGVSL